LDALDSVNKKEIGKMSAINIIPSTFSKFIHPSFSRLLIDFMSSLHLSIMSMIMSLLYFIVCCIIPQSPRYQCYCELKRDDYEKAMKVNSNLWNDEDLKPKSIFDLYAELKKSNHISLIGLIVVEQLIGGISILFYMKHFAQLTGKAKVK
jgi:Sugar (and other) transporter